MKKRKFTDSEKIKAVKSLESGMSCDEVCRTYGVAKTSLYEWKSKCSGMETSHLTRLKELEEGNRRLKRMYADLALDHAILKDIIGKKL